MCSGYECVGMVGKGHYSTQYKDTEQSQDKNKQTNSNNENDDKKTHHM